MSNILQFIKTTFKVSCCFIVGWLVAYNVSEFLRVAYNFPGLCLGIYVGYQVFKRWTTEEDD